VCAQPNLLLTVNPSSNLAWGQERTHQPRTLLYPVTSECVYVCLFILYRAKFELLSDGTR